MAALISSGLSQPIVDLVLMDSGAKDNWGKLLSVYEQSCIQRLSMLMMEFLKLQCDPEMDTAVYVNKVEKLFLDMNTELR
jgi:hypothetical protein